MKTLLLQTALKTVFMDVVRLVVFISLGATVGTIALAAQQVNDWQTQRLLHPTAAQRMHEQQGHVFIYDGLSDQKVNQALDQNFDRIGAMMFVNIKNVKTAKNEKDSSDAQGQQNTDADDTDDDGCE